MTLKIYGETPGEQIERVVAQFKEGGLTPLDLSRIFNTMVKVHGDEVRSQIPEHVESEVSGDIEIEK